MTVQQGPLRVLAVVMCAVLAAACGGQGLRVEDDTITLRAATGLGSQHAWWAETMEPWMGRVTELTGGQVEFESFVGGELVEVPDEVEAVHNGTIDVTLMLPIYTPDQFPMAEVTMLPVSESDAEVASVAWRNLLESDRELADGKTYYESQFGDKDIKAFAVSATQEYSISTTGRTIDSVADVQDLSLRTPSRVHEMYADEVGIGSVTVPAVEMFDSLSRGSFDGSFYSIADWSGYGFQDLFKYTLTDVNFGHFIATIGMRQQMWNELPPDVQGAMEQAHDEVFLPGAREWDDRADEMIAHNTGVGGEFVSADDLDPAVREHLFDGIADTWRSYAELLSDDDLPGRDAILLWRDLLVEAGGDVPDAIAEME